MVIEVLRQEVAPPSAGTDCKVLVWHWGRIGAGSKFTYELARSLSTESDMRLVVSASYGSQLEELVKSSSSMSLTTVPTFQGEKDSWSGKISAVKGMFLSPLTGYRFYRSLRMFDADIALCAMQSIWDAATLPVLRSRKQAFVLIVHEATQHPGEDQFHRQAILRRQIGAADAIITLTEHVAQMARDRHGYPADRMWVLPHPAFSFEAGGTAGPIAYRRLPVGRPFRLLFFGRITVYKDIGMLLNAYRILRDRGLNLELLIAGSGPITSPLRNLPGVSVRNGWIADDEIPSIFAQADLAVLPYVAGSQSGVVAAALATGLPIVATPIGGLKEQVADSGIGLVARDVSAEGIAEAIFRFISEPQLYSACSRRGLEAAMGDLSWETFGVKVAGILREIAARPRRGER